MRDYKIEVVVPHIDDLCRKLQAAYDGGAAGMFVPSRRGSENCLRA